MKRSIGVSWIGALTLSLITAPLAAQTTVQGAVIVQSGPAASGGEVRRVRRVIAAREVVVVERVHARRGWWKRHPYRLVTVYYDGSRFYRSAFRPSFRRVVVYEWGGRYYLDEDHWNRSYDARRHHHGERYEHDD
jgi:hypothetical protein